MKNIIVLIFIVACFVGLVTACSEKSKTITFSLDANGLYTGFSNLPEKYTIEDAKKDGHFVKQDSVVIANNGVWANFVETATKGNNTGVRMVNFFTEDTEDTTIPYFLDLFFNDGFYYLFDSSSDKQNLQPFSYLLRLEGQFGHLKKDTSVVVLTNDNALTFNVVMKAFVSSQFKPGGPPHKVVMFN
jgi:hypothetical protein